MTREQYIQILEHKDTNPNLMLTLIDSYLKDNNHSFNFVEFYNNISHIANSIEGFQLGLNPNEFFMVACEKSMRFYNEKFTVQPYRLHFASSTNVKVVNSLQKRYPRNFIDFFV